MTLAVGDVTVMGAVAVMMGRCVAVHTCLNACMHVRAAKSLCKDATDAACGELHL